MPEPAPEPAEQSRPLPVLAEPRTLDRPLPVSVPAAVVAATGGFILGVTAFVLMRVLRRPRAAGRVAARRRRSRRGERLEVAATRSFLVDVHLLKDR